MQYVKHKTDSRRDPFIFSLMHEFGGDGYMVYWCAIEILAHENAIDEPLKTTWLYLEHELLIDSEKLKKIMKFIVSHNKFTIKEQGEMLSIHCPKIREIMDEWQQRKRKIKEVTETGTIAHKCVLCFIQKYEEYMNGEKYVPTWARDTKHMKEILGVLGEAETVKRISLFFTNPDKWTLDKGLTIPMFKSQVNRLSGKDSATNAEKDYLKGFRKRGAK
jgi:hypothetical protein